MFARKKIIVAKIESSSRVDSMPSAADAIKTSNLSVQILQGDKVSEQVDRPTLGNDEQYHVAPNTKVSFDVYLRGSGTVGVAPNVSALLRACSMQEVINAGTSVKYNLVSENVESATLKYNLDGIEYALLGARGTWDLGISAKGLPMLKFEFTGLGVKGATAPAPSPNFASLPVPVAVEEARTEFSIGSFQAKLHSFSANVANSVVHRNLVNDESVMITDRAPAGSITIDMPTIAEWDFEADVRSNTKKVVSIAHGKTAGNIVEIDMPNVQVHSPSFGDADGIATLDLELNLLPSSGDDEISLTFK